MASLEEIRALAQLILEQCEELLAASTPPPSPEATKDHTINHGEGQ